jgi:nucleoside-diphosphate-sugar epimerase
VKSVVVTGARGLLGSHLVPLLAASATVHAVGRPGTAGESFAANVKPLPLDLSRPLNAAALPARVDTVVYFAQSSRFREFPETADDIFQINTAQVLAMLDHARRAGARNFVYASTGGVYAPSADPLTEESPLARPMGFYPASKRAAELLCESYSPYMNIAILRFFFIYGHGQSREMLLPRLVDSVRDGRAISLQGDEGLRINPVHASDAARATVAAATLEHSATINVAGPEVLSIAGICERIGNRVGRAPVFDRDPSAFAPALIADTTRMGNLLAAPTCFFNEGMEDLL